MWQPGREGSLGENGYMYMYGWLLCCAPETALLIGYTQHKINGLSNFKNETSEKQESCERGMTAEVRDSGMRKSRDLVPYYLPNYTWNRRTQKHWKERWKEIHEATKAQGTVLVSKWFYGKTVPWALVASCISFHLSFQCFCVLLFQV